tara:strand:- start:7679 stop:8617 length:939 start_codon:yes stop_codon:yes gene_type:complete
MNITILGYGIQGRAQALNLRDSGHNIIIGNRVDHYQQTALDDGFAVLPIEEAVVNADVVFVLIPDAFQNELLVEKIFPSITPATTIVFAHGYWLRFESNELPKEIDVLMIAPRFPGEQIRDTFLRGGGVPAFVDIAQDASGNAREILMNLTESLGFSKGGLIELTYGEEAEIDLFIEQFMAPTFFASVETAFEVLTENGYPKEAACLELYFSGELGAVRTMMGRNGLYKGFQDNASPTCQYGVASSRKILWGNDMKDKAVKQLERIVSGKFNEEISHHEKATKVLEEFVNSETAKEIKITESKVSKKIKKYL